jgi:hypothetical protein
MPYQNTNILGENPASPVAKKEVMRPNTWHSVRVHRALPTRFDRSGILVIKRTAPLILRTYRTIQQYLTCRFGPVDTAEHAPTMVDERATPETSEITRKPLANYAHERWVAFRAAGRSFDVARIL